MISSTPIDFTKPVQTVDGCQVEILKTDFKGTWYPVITVVTAPNGVQRLRRYTCSGRLCLNKEGPEDLINVPEEYTAWVNVYEDPRVPGRLYATRTEADWHAGRSGIRIACIPVTYKEGEGL